MCMSSTCLCLVRFCGLVGLNCSSPLNWWILLLSAIRGDVGCCITSGWTTASITVFSLSFAFTRSTVFFILLANNSYQYEVEDLLELLFFKFETIFHYESFSINPNLLKSFN
jgi:hypothetical protein